MINRDTNVQKSDNKPENVVIIRGGGDLASGTIHRLYRCGYRLLVLECEKPTAIRRMVSFCEAVYDGQSSVEGVLCRKVDSIEECEAVWKAGEIPLMVDTEGAVLKKYRPAALIDAILAKKNLGTTREMADLTVGLGPGFVAGEDVDYVVETMRGHNLARIITKGAAMPNTGVPGIIGGFGKERVLHAPAAVEEGAARSISSFWLSPSLKSRLIPTSAAAASELPPAIPAATGINFSRWISTPPLT